MVGDRVHAVIRGRDAGEVERHERSHLLGLAGHGYAHYQVDMEGGELRDAEVGGYANADGVAILRYPPTRCERESEEVAEVRCGRCAEGGLGLCE